MKSNKKNRGFSLVELIVVIAIMAVLVGVLAPAYLRYVEKTRLQKDISAIGEVIEATKVAGAEEAIAEEIPSTTAFLQEISVEIAETDGELSIKTSGGASPANSLLQELIDTIGTAVEFSHDVLIEKGAGFRVEMDKDYNVVVAVETYRYKNYPEVKAAIEDAFPVYTSLSVVAADLQAGAQAKYSEVYTQVYDETKAAAIANGATTIQAAYDAAYYATETAEKLRIYNAAYAEAEEEYGRWAIFYTSKIMEKANKTVEESADQIKATAIKAAEEAKATAAANNAANAETVANAAATASAGSAAVSYVLEQCNNDPAIKAALQEAADNAGQSLEEYIKDNYL